MRWKNTRNFFHILYLYLFPIYFSYILSFFLQFSIDFIISICQNYLRKVSDLDDSNIVAYAEATSLYIQSRRKQGTHKRRLFDLAIKRFESAIQTKPDDAVTVI